MKLLDDLMGRIFQGDRASQVKKHEAELAKIRAEKAAEQAKAAADAVAQAEAAAVAAAEEAEDAVEEAAEAQVVFEVFAKKAALSNEEVAARLDAQEQAHPEDLDWKKSIVDLMKLTGMDSSYKARKTMATEMGYSAEDMKKGSAEMNMWLHKQVIKEIAENGATLPAELMA